MAKTPAKKPAAKKTPAKKTPVVTVPRVKPKPPKKPLRERIRLAWHVLRGHNICD